METFDQATFPPTSVRWRLEGVTINGGVSVSSSPRLSLTDGGGFWICELSDIWLRTTDQLKAARAFEARMDRGATSLLVADRDIHLGAGSLNFSVIAAVDAPAALRATELDVAITVGIPLSGGEAFSIEHPTVGHRRYVVASAEAPVAGVQTITIRPPLREAVTDEALNFNAPTCTMRLANSGDFLEPIRLGRFSRMSPVFVEAF